MSGGGLTDCRLTVVADGKTGAGDKEREEDEDHEADARIHGKRQVDTRKGLMKVSVFVTSSPEASSADRWLEKGLTH